MTSGAGVRTKRYWGDAGGEYATKLTCPLLGPRNKKTSGHRNWTLGKGGAG